ncbi:MAG: FxsA family protein [Acidimicrobiales bacterium]
MIALALLALVVAELYALIVVIGAIGVLNTIGLMILISFVGAAVVKRAGLGVLRRAQSTLAAGGTPHNELLDGLLLLLAGVLLVLPGFVTATVGALLVLPPVRALLRGALIRGLKKRTSVAMRFVDGFGRRVDLPGGAPYEATATEVTEQPPKRKELEG